MEAIKNFLRGILIGISNAIPGVSGGTMAVVLNVYDRILYAVSLRNIKENLKFLIPLGMGATIGIFALSKVIIPLRDNYPMILGFCFMGLIIGSIPTIYRHAVEEGEDTHIRNVTVGIAAFLIMVVMSMMDQDGMVNQTLAEMGGLNLKTGIMLFVGTAVASIAMIIPGISGSLVMLLIGTYTVVMEAISSFDFMVLIPVAMGGTLGLIVGIKLIKNFMRFHPQMLYYGILGLVAGSLFPIYPGFEMSSEGAIAVIAMLISGSIAYLTSRPKKVLEK